MSNELPVGWERVSLDRVFEPRTDRVSPRDSPDAPFIGLEHVEAHSSRLLGTVPAATMASNAVRFVAGDVLYGRMRPYLNKVLRPQFAGLASAEFIVLPATTGMHAEFLLRRLSASDFVEFACRQYEGDRPRVKFDQLGRFELRVPPTAEQARIVDKLEELLSDLDAGVAELKAAQKKLVQYRQSLLKAAVEGKLTAARRAQHGEPEESGAQLLKRILRERRTRWERKQLAGFKAQAMEPAEGWQRKCPEPERPESGGIESLPSGWSWCTIDQLAEVGTGVTPLRSNALYFQGGTIPWVTSGALNDEAVEAAKEHVTDLAVADCRLKLYPPGSLLVAMYGEGKTRGKCAELLIPATINQAIAALVFTGAARDCKEYVKTFLLNSYEMMRAQASGGVQPNLNLQILKSIAVPLPPLAEQSAIADILAEHLVQQRRQSEAIERALRQSTAQRKNILQAAFSGRLVPQDPNDEPASVLLARIRAERAASDSPRTGARRARRPAAAA